MLWYKAWIDTRSRFLTALAVCLSWVVLTLQALETTARMNSQTVRTLESSPFAANRQLGFEMSKDINLHHYLAGVWPNALLTIPWMLFAALLGAGGLPSQAGGGGALFTLSLPVTRDRLLFTRTGVGLAELAVLAFVSTLAIPVAAPFFRLSYPVGDALVAALAILLREALAFSLALWLSILFADLWRPVLVAFAVTVLGPLAAVRVFDLRALEWVGLLPSDVLDYRGPAPWVRALICALAGWACIVAARRTLSRRDF